MATVDAHIYSGSNYKTNVTADTVIKAGLKGKIGKVIVNTVTATASITINDCAAVADASASNAILTIPSGTAVGTIFNVDCPVFLGIVAKFGTGTGALCVVYE